MSAGALASLPPPRWEVAPPADEAEVALLQDELGLPQALCALLAVRGFKDPAEAKGFLRPDPSALHSCHLLKDLPEASNRILRAIRDGETVLVHGDYDVDGMAGATLLTRWIRRVGGRAVPFLPHRVRDGYDLGPAGLKAATAAGASLIVTVDCGTLAHEAIEEAVRSGIDVVVSDHHAPGDTLPHAVAVVNPNRNDCFYPNKALCGSGVAFKICQGLAEELNVPAQELQGFLDLVALATVADLVTLTGENRVLTRIGLGILADTKNIGLQALKAEAGVSHGEVSAATVGFVLAPRLNAVGRLGDPNDALRLLMTDNLEEARTLAREAEDLNRRRREMDDRTLEEATAQLAESFDPTRDFGLVLHSRDWHPGVVGIVASRIVERVHRPAVLVAMGEGRGRGSARSIPGFHLLEAIRAAGEHLERFGGHRQAAGIEVREDCLDSFRVAFNREASERLGGRDLRPKISVDLQVALEEMTWEFFRFMRHFGPYGIGNPQPLFVARGVTLVRPPRVVGGGHLKTRLRQAGEEIEAIGFRLAHRLRPDQLGEGPFDAVFQLRDNEFRGMRSLQAHLKDLRPSGIPAEVDVP